MLLDAQLEGGVASAAAQAAAAERTGFAGVWAAEVTRDPMLALAVAAGATTDVTVGSNVVLVEAQDKDAPPTEKRAAHRPVPPRPENRCNRSGETPSASSSSSKELQVAAYTLSQ